MLKLYYSLKKVAKAVQNIGENYKCNVCGNEVAVTKVGGGTLVCCGQEMELLVAKEEAPAEAPTEAPVDAPAETEVETPVEETEE
jgi:superoxide reductase